MNRICPYCQNEIKNHGNYCIFCGSNLPSETTEDLLIDIHEQLITTQTQTNKTNKQLFAFTIVTGGIAIIALFVGYIQILSNENIHIPRGSLFDLGLIVTLFMILYTCVIIWMTIVQPIWENLSLNKK